MAERTTYDPQETGRDLPIVGAVDTLGGTGTTPRTREASKRLFPELMHGVDQATGHFLRLIGVKTGTVDGHEVGELTIGGGSTLLSRLSALIQRNTDDLLRAVHAAQDPHRIVKCEDAYRCLPFALDAARVTPTEIVDPGTAESLWGSSVTVYLSGGTFDLYVDSPAADPIPVLALTWPAMAPQIVNHRFRRLFVVNAAQQQGTTMRLYIGRGA